MTDSSPNVSDLIEQGQRLVHSLAGRIYRSIPVKVDIDDLVAYGQVGLAESARDFQPDRGVQFTTFAYYRIRGAIYDGLAKMSWTNRARFNRWRYQQLAEAAIESDGESPQDDSLIEDVKWFAGATQKLAIVFFGSQDEESGLRDSSIEDPRSRSAALIAAQREIVEVLKKLVQTLPLTEKTLIELVYFEGLTLQEASARTGISKSWASRLHARILEDLAQSLRRLGIQR